MKYQGLRSVEKYEQYTCWHGPNNNDHRHIRQKRNGQVKELCVVWTAEKNTKNFRHERKKNSKRMAVT